MKKFNFIFIFFFTLAFCTNVFAGRKEKSSVSRDSTPDSEPYTITTTSPPNISTPSSEEVIFPQPAPVNKFNGVRDPKHANVFKEKTGYDSAREYAENKKKDFKNPQIGHIQGYQNHGPIADTTENNLVVISQSTNLAMNKADNKYKDGNIDANSMIITKGTKIGKASIQQLANPSNPQLPITPSIVIPEGFEKQSPEAKEKYKKQIERAFDPERMKRERKKQESSTYNGPTLKEEQKMIQKKLEEDRQKGIVRKKVYKLTSSKL